MRPFPSVALGPGLPSALSNLSPHSNFQVFFSGFGMGFQFFNGSGESDVCLAHQVNAVWKKGSMNLGNFHQFVPSKSHHS